MQPERIRLHDPDAYVAAFPCEMLDWLRANEPVFRHEDDINGVSGRARRLRSNLINGIKELPVHFRS